MCVTARKIIRQRQGALIIMFDKRVDVDDGGVGAIEKHLNDVGEVATDVVASQDACTICVDAYRYMRFKFVKPVPDAVG